MGLCFIRSPGTASQPTPQRYRAHVGGTREGVGKTGVICIYMTYLVSAKKGEETGPLSGWGDDRGWRHASSWTFRKVPVSSCWSARSSRGPRRRGSRLSRGGNCGGPSPRWLILSDWTSSPQYPFGPSHLPGRNRCLLEARGCDPPWANRQRYYLRASQALLLRVTAGVSPVAMRFTPFVGCSWERG